MKARAQTTRRLLAIVLALAGVLPAGAGCDVGCPLGAMACCDSASLPAVASPCCAPPSASDDPAVVPATATGKVPADAPTGLLGSADSGLEPSGGVPALASRGPSAPVPLFLLHSVLLS